MSRSVASRVALAALAAVLTALPAGAVFAASPPPVAKLLHTHALVARGGAGVAATAVDPPDPSNGTPPLVYGVLGTQGAVQHHPVVDLVFWGPKWTASDPVVVAMRNLFGDLVGGDYNNMLSQYTDRFGAPDNFVHNDGMVLGSTWITGTTPNVDLTAQEIGQEAVFAINANGWTNNGDTQVIVVPQQGTTYDAGDFTNVCGEHSVITFGVTTAIWGMALFPSDAIINNGGNCNFGSSSSNPEQSIARIASHEYAEMATDPGADASGWATKENPSNKFLEIGDLCNYDTQTYTPINLSTTSYVTYLWNNAYRDSSHSVGGCTVLQGREFNAPNFPGRHTVQGAILGTYTSGSYQTWLAQPLTEETPIAGGRVSYFSGLNYCGGGASFGGSASGSAIYWSHATGAREVDGCLYARYSRMGEANSGLGFPTSNVVTLNGGYASYFAGHPCTQTGPNNSHSALYNSSLGTYYVWGCIYQRYFQSDLNQANGKLGFPVTDEIAINGGHVSYFAGQSCNGGGPNGSGSAIFSSGKGTFEVQGCIYALYSGYGATSSTTFGWPVSDEVAAANGGRVSYFANQVCTAAGPDGSGSAIYYHGFAHEVHGCIYHKYWSQMNGPGGVLGYPTTDEIGTTSGYSGAGARLSKFDNGAIYWYSGSGWEVQGAIYGKYVSIGAEFSDLGFPSDDEHYLYSNGVPFARSSDFENGFIDWDINTHAVTCWDYTTASTC